MIKRTLRGLTLGLITFAVGLGVASVWQSQRTISLCEVEARPESFAGKTIRFRALVGRTPYSVIAGSACAAEESAWVSVELDAGALEKLPLDEPAKTSGASRVLHLTDAVIVGQLNPNFGLGCFGPKYHVKNARIERILSSHALNESEDFVQWFKSNSY